MKARMTKEIVKNKMDQAVIPTLPVSLRMKTKLRTTRHFVIGETASAGIANYLTGKFIRNVNSYKWLQMQEGKGDMTSIMLFNLHKIRA